VAASVGVTAFTSGCHDRALFTPAPPSNSAIRVAESQSVIQLGRRRSRRARGREACATLWTHGSRRRQPGLRGQGRPRLPRRSFDGGLDPRGLGARGSPCPCGSGKRYKKCCRPR
jgi:hypothetical protein